MKNRWEKTSAILAVVLIALVGIAARHEILTVTKLWVDTHIEFEGATNNAYETTITATDPTADRSITLPDTSGAIVTTGDTSTVSATMIADPTVSFDLPLVACLVDGTGPITSATAPNLTTVDNIAAILYDDSSETTGVSWTFRIPSDYSTDLGFYVMVSSNDASGSGTILDYQFFVNNDDTGFASATAQTQVACTSATLDASNEVLHLNPDATAEALFTSGAWVTLEVFNASTNDDDLEIKGVQGYYTATQ